MDYSILNEIDAALEDNASLDSMTKFTLADAIREGCKTTTQVIGSWGNPTTTVSLNGASEVLPTACALSAARVALVSRGYLK